LGVVYKLHAPDAISSYGFSTTICVGENLRGREFLKMPLSVQGHHALMDGIHVAKFYTGVQNYFDHPETFLGNI
jgi:hypothetical protein